MQGAGVDALFRGTGAIAVKSVEFASSSVQPQASGSIAVGLVMSFSSLSLWSFAPPRVLLAESGRPEKGWGWVSSRRGGREPRGPW